MSIESPSVISERAASLPPVSRGSVADKTSWMLVGSLSGKDDVTTILVHPMPFNVGRRPGCSLQLNHRTVSSNHAELKVENRQLWVVDLGSTNGTYVNGRRVAEPTELNEEDLVQFAEVAFRVRRQERGNASQTVAEDVCDQALALVQFDRLMENRLVTPNFQPIVHVQTGKILGYEVLARSRLFGLESCGAMFSAAARLNMEVELSRMLRWEGIREALNLPRSSTLFVNTHPLEIQKEGLIESMVQVRQLSQEVPIVLEIHEAAVTDPKQMRELRAQLQEVRIGLAYDDFGAGQTRLAELTESPPDYLKFDMGLIRGIDQAGPERQRLVSTLVSITVELGIIPLAEGIETKGEAEVCRQMGFVTAQGYYYGRPAPLRNNAP